MKRPAARPWCRPITAGFVYHNRSGDILPGVHGGTMSKEYEINQMAKEDSWRMFRIIGELVEGFDTLADIVPAVTIYGSARFSPENEIYKQVENIAYGLGKA